MKKEKLKEILDSFKNLKIGVIGDLMLDDYLIGSVDRISPEAPVPVVSIKSEKFSLGGAANVANNLSVLGAKVFCFGVIGRDFDGDRLEKELRKKDIDISGIIKVDDKPTIVKRRVISGNHQLLRLDWEDNSFIRKNTENKLLEKLERVLEELDAVIISDYNKGLLTPRVTKKIIELCNEKKIVVTVDPKPSNVANYFGATSMTPNRKEAAECLGKKVSEDMDEIGKELKAKLGLRNLLLTKSEEGMSLFRNDELINIPTYAEEVFDVTGAGDTVISLYTLGLAQGLDPEISAKIANTAAGVVVGKMGTSTVTALEILDFYNKIYKEED
ncbi:MAG: D-glycero-beta-D-manno-heptose-7-phosphate kinase [Cetobacterium sp.]